MLGSNPSVINDSERTTSMYCVAFLGDEQADKMIVKLTKQIAYTTLSRDLAINFICCQTDKFLDSSYNISYAEDSQLRNRTNNNANKNI